MKLLETKRLILRELDLDDLDTMYALDTDPNVMKYIWTCHSKPISKKEELERIKRSMVYYDRHPGLGVFTTIEKDSNSIIGWSSLKDLDNSEHTEVGYRYFEEFWGKGYATEAATALRDHGFKNVGLNEIVAVTHPDNKASQKVLLKIGLSYRGKAHYYNVDVDFFELKNEDWQENYSSV